MTTNKYKEMRNIDDRHELQIHVVGLCGSGKSTIQAMIIDYLRVMGFNAEMGYNTDFQTEDEMRETLGPIMDRIGHISQLNNRIVVNEVSAARPIKENVS